MSPLDEIRILEKQNRLRMSQVYSVPAHQLSDGLVFQGFIARALKDSQLTRQPPGEKTSCFGHRSLGSRENMLVSRSRYHKKLWQFRPLFEKSQAPYAKPH